MLPYGIAAPTGTSCLRGEEARAGRCIYAQVSFQPPRRPVVDPGRATALQQVARLILVPPQRIPKKQNVPIDLCAIGMDIVGFAQT